MAGPPLPANHAKCAPVWCIAWTFLSSPWLTIGTLLLLAACLAGGTLVDAAYGTRLARELVYHTWWFTLLLLVLAVNVLTAAVRKYPWQRHQAGFVIAHAGLLLLLCGGLLTALGGEVGQVLLVDSADAAIQNRFGLAQQTSVLSFADRHQLEVYQLTAARKDPKLFPAFLQALEGGGEPDGDLQQLVEQRWRLAFRPGTLPWRLTSGMPSGAPLAVRALQWLANPLPGYGEVLAGDTSIQLDDFWPHTTHQPFRRVGVGEGAPVLRVQLASPMLSKPAERWVSPQAPPQPEISPILFELFELRSLALLPEFLTPPTSADQGPDGQLALAVDGQTVRVQIDRRRLGQTQGLPGKRLFKLVEYTPNFFGKDADQNEAAPSCPALRFIVEGPGGITQGTAFARLPRLNELRGPEAKLFATWYHFPDFSWGQEHALGSVQFLQAADGQLWWRIYGKEGLLQPGQPFDPEQPNIVHSLPFRGMQMVLRVLDYLPNAVHEDDYVVEEVAPGAIAPPQLRPVVAGHLRIGGQEQAFWARMNGRPTVVSVGGKTLVLRYRLDTRPLGFSLSLVRARQELDLGSSRPASVSSTVLVGKVNTPVSIGGERVIGMNQPLRQGQYTAYQTHFEPLIDPRTQQAVLDSDGRHVSLSGLTLTQDPGLWVKYAGSALAVLGLAMMFWMPAWLARPRTSATSDSAVINLRVSVEELSPRATAQRNQPVDSFIQPGEDAHADAIG